MSWEWDPTIVTRDGEEMEMEYEEYHNTPKHHKRGVLNELLEEGLTLSQIANRLGVSIASIQRQIQRNNLSDKVNGANKLSKRERGENGALIDLNPDVLQEPESFECPECGLVYSTRKDQVKCTNSDLRQIANDVNLNEETGPGNFFN